MLFLLTSVFRTGLSANFAAFSQFRSLTTRRSLSTNISKPLTRMRVIPVEALSDNYMYILIDEKDKVCAVVDPVEPDKLLNRIAQEEGIKLTTILTTHHHWDHAGGNDKLVKMVPGLDVYGADDRIGALNRRVGHEKTFKMGSLDIKALSTPCHTSGHICYFVANDREGEPPVVFTGDTLFVAGCGRFFEGSPQQMYHALVEILGTLPPSTQVYCGHEYTVTNLKFAATVEPSNTAVADKLAWATDQRKMGRPTIPSTIGDELSFNPFMRVRESSVQQNAKTVGDPIATMAGIRAQKDVFRG